MNDLPLYDLHVHYGGAIPVETICSILREEEHLPKDLATLRKMMTYEGDDGPYDFDKFLRKFDVLNAITWNEERIDRCTRAVVDLLVRQGVSYAEIRFSINKYVSHLEMSPKEVTVFLCSRLKQIGLEAGVRLAPVLSVKYESDRASQREVTKLIDNADVCDCLAGIDLVGDERFFDADFYAPIFAEWKAAGKGLIAHVGESQSAENVRLAIERMGVQRVSHGIRAIDDPDILALANDKGVAFDVALTSNLKTGVITDLRTHPIIKLLEAGCQVSLGTDDPVILDTTLQKEFEVAQRVVGLSADTIEKIKQTAIDQALI